MEETNKTSKKYANISIQPLQKAPAAKPELGSFVLPQDGLSDREVMAEPTCYVKNKRRIAHVPRFPLPILKKPLRPDPIETSHSSISEKKEPSDEFIECSTAKNPKHTIKLSNLDDSFNKEEKKNDKKRINEDLTECSVNKKLKKIETAHSSDSVNKEKEKNHKKRSIEDLTECSVNKKLKKIETAHSSDSVNEEKKMNHKKRKNEDLTDYSVNKKLKKIETPRCIESVQSKYYVAVLARTKSLCYALVSKNIDPASASCELAAKYGPYKTYSNCPASKGLLQFDLWNVEPSNLWDWNSLKKKIAKHGLRNSLVTITCNTEMESKMFGHLNSVEPLDTNTNTFNTNIKRRFISFGEREPKEFLVVIVNPHLLKDLHDRNLWNENVISELVDNMGSIQELKNIPEDLKRLYRTKWEIDQKAFVRMAADRAPFIDQSQALYLYMAEANEEEISDMHISTWKLGLKTGVSQLRIKQTEEDLRD